MKTWIVSSLDEETIQEEETIWGNTVYAILQWKYVSPCWKPFLFQSAIMTNFQKDSSKVLLF